MKPQMKLAFVTGAEFVRDGQMMYSFAQGEDGSLQEAGVKNCESINAAKRLSLDLQKQGKKVRVFKREGKAWNPVKSLKKPSRARKVFSSTAEGELSVTHGRLY